MAEQYPEKRDLVVIRNRADDLGVALRQVVEQREDPLPFDGDELVEHLNLLNRLPDKIPGPATLLAVKAVLKDCRRVFRDAHSQNLGAQGNPELLRFDTLISSLIGDFSLITDRDDPAWLVAGPDLPGQIERTLPHADAARAESAVHKAVFGRFLDIGQSLTAAALGAELSAPLIDKTTAIALTAAHIATHLLSPSLCKAWLDYLLDRLDETVTAFRLAVNSTKDVLEQARDGLYTAASGAAALARLAVQSGRTFVRRVFWQRAAVQRVGSPQPSPPSPNPCPDLHVFRDVDEPWCPEMVVIPSGSFVMGSPEDEPGRRDNEGPRVRVEVAKFALGVYAVTFDEYDPFCRDTGRPEVRDAGWGRGRQPAIGIWWQDASDYCAWLSNKTGTAYRLPSEAEWEYACRAGSDTPFWWGDAISSDQANCDATWPDNGGEQGERLGRAVPVDQYGPSPWKLYQTHGNAMEWCADRWVGSHEGRSRFGQAPADRQDSERDLWVLRGGCWFSRPEALRSAARSVGGPDSRYNGIGFRVARTLAA